MRAKDKLHLGQTVHGVFSRSNSSPVPVPLQSTWQRMKGCAAVRKPPVDWKPLDRDLLCLHPGWDKQIQEM